MNNFTLRKQKPKPQKTGQVGYLAVADKTALFCSPGHIILEKLDRPELLFINGEGIMLRGFQENGADKAGRLKFYYQEWLCSYND